MEKQTMLLVTARAVDAVESGGGMIAKYAGEGHRIVLIVLTDLEGQERRPLLVEACLELGVSQVEFAGLPGLPLAFRDEDCEWLAWRIREIRPDFIVTHANEPDLRTPDRGYTSAAVKKACAVASAAGVPCKGLAVSLQHIPTFGLEPEYPEEIGWKPGILIDVTPFFDQKLDVIGRIFPGDEYRRQRCMERAKNRAVHCSGRGGVAGCQFAEAFSCFGPVCAFGSFVW